MDAETLSERLATFLALEIGEDVAVSGLSALAGGASRAAYAFDLTESSGDARRTRALVLRLDLGGEIYKTALSRREEFRVLDAARGAGVAVPAVHWVCDNPRALERDFLIMERIEGETIGRKIVSRDDLSGARGKLGVQMGRQLAKIHAIDATTLEFLPHPAPGESPARAALARAREELDRIEDPQPALEIGWRWLHDNAPECKCPVLVHGDFRIGNVIVAEDGLRAVIDWEFSAIGDPHEDLAWPFVADWRFGRRELRFGGVSDGRDFLEAYEAESGRTVDERARAYWEILGNFRWALGCLTQARRHLSGQERSVELASLGRRSAEMALEMFALIEQAERED